MGNYKDLEYEFVERTLSLISQYEKSKKQYSFEEQYDHTLLINCLLGLIVLPKERTISFIPTARLTKKLKAEMGITTSYLNEEITNLRDLIFSLRHSIAHFDLKIISRDNNFLIDEIIFLNREKGDDYQIALFIAPELLSFIRFYGNWLLNNLKYRS